MSKYTNKLTDVKERGKYLFALLSSESRSAVENKEQSTSLFIKIIKKAGKVFLLLVSKIAAKIPGIILHNIIGYFLLRIISRVLIFIIKTAQKRLQKKFILFDKLTVGELEFTDFDTPEVSIIIPVHNQFDYTFRCLYSIRQHVTDIAYEIIVTDDQSMDETVRIQDRVKNITYIRNEPALGFLRNCNQAARAARGKFLVFLNNDTVVQPLWLESLVDVFRNNHQAGMVGSKLVYPDGVLQEAGGIIWNDASGWNFGKFKQPEDSAFNYVKTCDYISGASIIIRHDLWKTLGGFDDRYAPAYFEDSDLAFGVRKLGFETIYQPKSVVVHFEGISHGTDISQGVKKHQEINKATFIEKWKTELQQQFAPGEDVFQARDRSKHKKCIVVIDHYVPEPDRDAGSKTVFQYLQLFVELGLNVKFIGDNFLRKEPYTSQLQQMGIEVLYGGWYAQTWRKWLAENNKYIDYIFINRPHIAAKYLPFIKETCSAKTIFYGHDLHYLREERQAQLENRKHLLQQAKKTKEKEFHIFSMVDLVLYPSLTEKQEIHRHQPGINVAVMPPYFFNPTEEKYLAEQRADLLFVGGFNHPPNVDAVSWFVNDIFPLIQKNIPDIKLNIVGSNAPEQILKMASPQIIVHGFVSDEKLAQLYASCKMVVVPLRYGAGIKGKVVEALAFGMPVVSTQTGVEGLNNADQTILVEETATDFATRVCQTYLNHDLLESTSVRSKEFIRKFFSREAALGFIRNEMLTPETGHVKH